MTDVMSAVGSVKQLTATLASLGPELSAAAPNGNFGAVLSQVNAELAAVNDGGVVPTASAPAGPSTSALLGGGSSGGLSALYSPASPGTPTGAQVVSDAEKYLGVPYVWGGTNPATGLDCSGLVQHVYGELGVSLPRTSQEQAQVGTPVASLADAQPGDLVFFAGSDGTAGAPGHVGIYIGNGQMIDAPHTGTDVRIESVGNPVSIRRVLPSPSASSASTVDLTAAGVFGGQSGVFGGQSGVFGAASGVFGAGQASAGGPTSAGMNSLGVPASLQPLFEAAGQRYGVNPLLLASVARQESGFQTGVVSSAGAVGLMQLMPATAAGLGVNPSDPSSAIDGAAQLLSGYLSSYKGSVPLALAAYNAGPGAVNEYGGVPPYAETQGYVANITSMLSSAEQAVTV